MSEKIEITVKVNGKEVPLSSISTETFEKIKKAEVLESAPIASVCDCGLGGRRLLLKLPHNLVFSNCPEVKAIAIDLKDGSTTGCCDVFSSTNYRNKQVIR